MSNETVSTPNSNAVSRSEWLAGLKAGDTVVVQPGHYGVRPYLSLVEKVGKIHITVGGHKYSVKHGSGGGGDKFSQSSDLDPATEANVAGVKRGNDEAAVHGLVECLGRGSVQNLSNDDLATVLGLLRSARTLLNPVKR